MKEQLNARLETLKSEYETGQKMLADLEARRTELQHTLMRISGAIQVIDELLDEDQKGENEGAASGYTDKHDAVKLAEFAKQSSS